MVRRLFLFIFLVTLLMINSYVLAQDLNRDGVVDRIDEALVARAFGSKQGDPNWNPNLDLKRDGVIDMRDVSLVARYVDRQQGFFSRISSFFQSISKSFVNYFSTFTAGPTMLNVDPPEIVDTTLTTGKEFTVDITVNDVNDLFNWQIMLSFNPKVLQCTGASYPDDNVFTGKTAIPVTPTIDNTKGSVAYGHSLSGTESVSIQSGKLCNIKFKVVGSDDSGLTRSALTFSSPYGGDTFLLDSDLNPIPAVVNNGFFSNQGSTTTTTSSTTTSSSTTTTRGSSSTTTSASSTTTTRGSSSTTTTIANDCVSYFGGFCTSQNCMAFCVGAGCSGTGQWSGNHCGNVNLNCCICYNCPTTVATTSTTTSSTTTSSSTTTTGGSSSTTTSASSTTTTGGSSSTTTTAPSSYLCCAANSGACPSAVCQKGTACAAPNTYTCQKSGDRCSNNKCCGSTNYLCNDYYPEEVCVGWNRVFANCGNCVQILGNSALNYNKCWASGKNDCNADAACHGKYPGDSCETGKSCTNYCLCLPCLSAGTGCNPEGATCCSGSCSNGFCSTTSATTRSIEKQSLIDSIMQLFKNLFGIK